MPSLPLHPLLAPLLRGGAVPGRWLADVRVAGDWADRFVNEGWESLQALCALSYSALLASPLGDGSGALAAALGQLEDGESEVAEGEATAPRRAFDDSAGRSGDSRDRSRQPADRLAPAGRRPPLPPLLPLPPPSPSGPISAAMAAARLAQRAAAAGLEPALHPGLGPQSASRHVASGVAQAPALALALAAGWHHVVGFARQAAAAGSPAPLFAGEVQVAARSMPDSVRPVTTGDAATRFADAVERALRGASSMPSPDGRARARVAAADPSWPAAAARGRPGAEPVAQDEGAARGEPLAVAGAGRAAARTAAQGLTGLRGLAARAAAAGFDDPIEGRRRATVEAAAAPPAQPPRDETRSRPERSASPAALDDEQLAAQLTRVLRREAERDGVDIDDLLP